MEIFPKLHWLPAGRVNAYLYQDAAGLLLIDTGLPGQLDLDRYLSQLGLLPSQITHILLTHADLDHAGNVARFHHLTNAIILAGPQTTELLRRGVSPSHNFWLMDQITTRFWRYMPPPAGAIQVIHDGQVLPLMEGLQVLATPGHTADHIAFYSPASGILFAGDALNTRQGRLNCSPRFISADYAVACRSAARLLQCTPALFACGHGRPRQDHTVEEVMALFDALRA